MNKPSTLDQADVVAAARGWLDTRWLHQGRTRSGVDCVGLVVVVAAQARGSAFDVRDYARIASDERMLAVCDALLIRRTTLAEMQPGDVVVMHYNEQRHMGIVTPYHWGGLGLIHAYAPARKVVETRLSEDILARVLAAYRWPAHPLPAQVEGC
jgi:cell wall-associated NlpC family hydrolase